MLLAIAASGLPPGSPLADLARPADEVGGARRHARLVSARPHRAARLPLVGGRRVIVLGVVVGFGRRLAGEVAQSLRRQLIEQPNRRSSGMPDAIAEMKRIFRTMRCPPFRAAVWVFILFDCFYVAAALVRMSGPAQAPARRRGRRPAPAAAAGRRLRRRGWFSPSSAASGRLGRRVSRRASGRLRAGRPCRRCTHRTPRQSGALARSSARLRRWCCCSPCRSLSSSSPACCDTQRPLPRPPRAGPHDNPDTHSTRKGTEHGSHPA